MSTLTTQPTPTRTRWLPVVFGCVVVALVVVLLWPASPFEEVAGPPLRVGSVTALSDTTALALQVRDADQVPSAALLKLDEGGVASWSELKPPAGLTRNHTATLLGDGRVLVLGGQRQGWLLDVERNNVTSTASMPAPHGARHTATRLSDGRVLVTGGLDETREEMRALPNLSIYDPVANTWSNAGVMSTPRYAHTASLLPSGVVLIVGGIEPGNIQRPPWTDRFDPVTGEVERLPGLNTRRAAHEAAVLPSGELLVCGGADGINSAEVPFRSAEVFNPTTKTWREVAPMRHARRDFALVMLPGGRALIVGGWWRNSNTSLGGFGYQFYAARERFLGIPRRQQLTRTELFDPELGRWSSGPRLQHDRVVPVAAAVGRGVLVWGGDQRPEWRLF